MLVCLSHKKYNGNIKLRSLSIAKNQFPSLPWPASPGKIFFVLIPAINFENLNSSENEFLWVLGLSIFWKLKNNLSTNSLFYFHHNSFWEINFFNTWQRTNMVRLHLNDNQFLYFLYSHGQDSLWRWFSD